MPKKQPDLQKVESFTSRPPIIVILGHVDHGKTTLLDAIRQTDVAASEHGGITQSIGAYQVRVGTASDQVLTFIDTPGHQAFAQMRSRGAKVADIAILVVAANDSVMPQTVESIKIIQEARIPYIVAINKVDLPEANVDKVIQDLLAHNVLLENYGGDVPWVKVSAKNKQGIKELIELIELIGQLNEIKGDLQASLEAVVIESKLDKNRGAVAAAIIRSGMLRVGDKIYIDGIESKVRGLFDYQQKLVKEALPGMPVEIIGLSQVPAVGAKLGLSSQLSQRVSDIAKTNQTQETQTQRLNIILKADTLGSLEAILSSLPENVNLISWGVGQIGSGDILSAKNTGSIVMGFNVTLDPAAKRLQESEKVLVRSYKIIYELLDELRDAAAGVIQMQQEEILGKGQIIAEFPYENLKVSGTRILEGRLAKGDTVKVYRGEQLLGESRIKSMRIGKEEVNKTEVSKECGILLDPQVEFAIGDIIEAYKKY